MVQLRPLSRRKIMFLVGVVPLAWVILLLFHPAGEGEDLYSDLRDQVTPCWSSTSGCCSSSP
jgi:hypothetical protein